MAVEGGESGGVLECRKGMGRSTRKWEGVKRGNRKRSEKRRRMGRNGKLR